MTMQSAQVRKVLVCEIAGLGDNVHLLPALWLVRQQWPQAELHVMVAEPLRSLFEITPWVQRVWGYPRSPKPGLCGQWRLGRQLRDEHFDVVIDTKCTDRSSVLCWLSRAPVRLGRRPSDGGPPGWRHLFTQVMDHPYYREAMYLQKWHCLRAAGLGNGEADEPVFSVRIDPALRRAQGIDAVDDGHYVHISPCTSSTDRELPVAQLAQVIDAMVAAHPALKVVLSCSADPRERQRVRDLLGALAAPAWRVFQGELSLAALASVIQGARLNASGDTGSLHLAMMAGTPALAWFRPHRGQDEWIPHRVPSRVLIAPTDDRRDALHGLDTTALVGAALELLAST